LAIFSLVVCAGRENEKIIQPTAYFAIFLLVEGRRRMIKKSFKGTFIEPDFWGWYIRERIFRQG